MKSKKLRSVNHSNHIVHWTMAGLEYGYPICCIGEFVIHAIKGTSEHREKRKFNGTGYVPCVLCNEKTEAELLAYIAAHRQYKKPFPQCG